jgi:hypothetical protein
MAQGLMVRQTGRNYLYADRAILPRREKQEPTMLTKTFPAILTAFLIIGSASVTLANDIDESASGAQVDRESRGGQLPKWWNGRTSPADPFAMSPAPWHERASPRR